MGLVHYVAQRYKSLGEYDDLVQAGYEGLIYAVDHFDPTEGHGLSTYAVPSIRGSIQHYLRDKSSSVRIPGRLQEVIAQTSKVVDEYTQLHGSAPTIPTIAATLGLEQDLVLQAMDANVARSTISTDTEENPISNLAATDNAIEAFENSEAIRQALSTLTDIDRRAVELRFFGNRTQTQIAQDLGISQMQVSRILAKALRELRPLLRDI